MGSDRRGAGPVLVAVILLIGGLSAGFFAWWLPDFRIKRRCANERSAYTCLGVLFTAEAEFRANDRDKNGVHDYWTGDVAGLYRFGLIDRTIAEADLRPIVPLVPCPIPKNGYYFTVFEIDDSVNPAEEYRKDTDGKSGKVHNTCRFGIVAIPAEYGVTGYTTYFINEGATRFGCGLEWKGNLVWPSDQNLRAKWYWHNVG